MPPAASASPSPRAQSRHRASAAAGQKKRRAEQHRRNRLSATLEEKTVVYCSFDAEWPHKDDEARRKTLGAMMSCSVILSTLWSNENTEAQKAWVEAVGFPFGDAVAKWKIKMKIGGGKEQTFTIDMFINPKSDRVLPKEVLQNVAALKVWNRGSVKLHRPLERHFLDKVTYNEEEKQYYLQSKEFFKEANKGPTASCTQLRRVSVRDCVAICVDLRRMGLYGPDFTFVEAGAGDGTFAMVMALVNQPYCVRAIEARPRIALALLNVCHRVLHNAIADKDWDLAELIKLIVPECAVVSSDALGPRKWAAPLLQNLAWAPNSAAAAFKFPVQDVWDSLAAAATYAPGELAKKAALATRRLRGEIEKVENGATTTRPERKQRVPHNASTLG